MPGEVPLGEPPSRVGASWRPSTGSIPAAPGVYRFRDADSNVIYVGKALNLRARLASYFADPSGLHPRTAAMIGAASSVDWVTVPTELDALQLEYSWIKEFEPRFNVRYRDDKSFPFIAVTMGEEFPRVFVMRGARRKGTRHFGPYPQGWAVRDTLERLMLRSFPIRTCTDAVFRRHHILGRPCLLGDIGKCRAPCVGRITAEEHRAIAENLCSFLGGRAHEIIRDLETRMGDAAAAQDYEAAARLRDEVAALRQALERSAVVMREGTEADALAIAEDELQAVVQVFHIRDGRVAGQRGFAIERPVDVPEAELIEQVLVQVYGDMDASDLPPEIWVESEPSGAATLAEWLSALRGRAVRVKVPRRGKKRDLLSTVRANAAQDLAARKLRRGADLVARGRAIDELRIALGLAAAPLRIECIDVSSHSGTDQVASLVVFDDGLPAKREYRSYVLDPVPDDAAAVRQAVERRYRMREGRGRYRPGLLLIDGGRPQADAAWQALASLGAEDIPVRGLAKRLEEIWAPGGADPVVMSRRSEGLYLLQRVRDEAHRVAIAHHRKRRGKRVTGSVLDGVAGLGPARKAALIRHWGSVRRLRSATEDELMEVPGIGPSLAAAIRRALAGAPGATAVDVATGEIIDHS